MAAEFMFETTQSSIRSDAPLAKCAVGERSPNEGVCAQLGGGLQY
jgi:hypothetical protein